MAQFPAFTADSFGFRGQGAEFGVEWRHFYPQVSLSPYAGETAGQLGLPLSGDQLPLTAQSPVPVSRANPCGIPTAQSAVKSIVWGEGCGLIGIIATLYWSYFTGTGWAFLCNSCIRVFVLSDNFQC